MAIVELITAVAVGAILMEAPHWDVPTQHLYFVDILGEEVHYYDPVRNRSSGGPIIGLEGSKVGFILPVEGRKGFFVAGVMNKLEYLFWDPDTMPQARRIDTLAEFDSNLNETMRFNDGKADREGRVFGGTMADEEVGSIENFPIGTLYRYAPTTRNEGSLKGNLTLSNGLTWNDKTNKFYFIDSLDFNIRVFDYDAATGDISNERVLIDFTVNGQPPDFIADGMTIDENGDLWVALFGGGRVMKVNGTTGEVMEEIEIPGAPQPTSAAFGGPNLDELYVTTGAFGGLPPPSGGLFRIRELGVRGTQMYNVRMD